jgi:hypothetical protein
MTTFYGPKSPAFRGGPNHFIAYDVILAPTVVHGPDIPVAIVSDDLPIINHFDLPDCFRAIAPPLIMPDDVSTLEGKLTHYNRVRMIAASILFHHGLDGSFSQAARERVRHDTNLVLSYTAEMVLFIASPNEFINRPMDYPPILEAEWIGTYPSDTYFNRVHYNGDYIGRRINNKYQVIFGPQTFLDYLVDNDDERYEVLERLDNHRYLYENQGNVVLTNWVIRAIDCWHKHKECLRKNNDCRYAPEIGDDIPFFNWGADYKIVPYDSDD